MHKKIRNERISAKYWERKKEEDAWQKAEEAQRVAEEKKRWEYEDANEALLTLEEAERARRRRNAQVAVEQAYQILENTIEYQTWIKAQNHANDIDLPPFPEARKIHQNAQARKRRAFVKLKDLIEYKEWIRAQNRLNETQNFSYAHQEWKKAKSKYNTQRRALEYKCIPLNKKFEGSEGHHIDKNYIIYIDTEKHREHYGHVPKHPKTMVKINTIAWEFLESLPLNQRYYPAGVNLKKLKRKTT
jgi:hypothetical protein